MEFETRVKRLIEQHYPEAEVQVGFEYGAEKLNGHMVWKGFEHKEMLRRQRELYAYLQNELGEEAKRISIIFTYSPHEVQTMQAVG